MTSPASLSSLLTTLTKVLTSASASLPIASSISPPSDGISLLDTKNELLLSYLHNLVFLIVLKIRSHSPHSTDLKPRSENHGREAENEDKTLRDEVTKKLVELRVYLEKGVRPLEGKLRYQIEKLVSAANEADAASKSASTKELAANGTQKDRSKQDNVGEGSGGDDDDHDDEHADPDEENAPTSINPMISDLSHRPNPSAFTRPSQPAASHSTTTTTGPYKPPRITPTSLPTTTSAPQKASRQRTSHTLNEYIREEIDDAPLAEPSIGAGSGLRGREKAREEERRVYEEMRLVRLPEEKGKGKGKRRGGEIGGDGRADLEGGFGGVGGVDFGGGGKRRKREDGGGGGGGGGTIGEAWGRRVKRGIGRKGKR